MKTTLRFKARNFILGVALYAGLGLSPHATAQERSYLVDFNSKTARELGSLGDGETVAWAINHVGQVVGESRVSGGQTVLSLPAPVGQA